jgi:hypothetical protein
MRCLVKGCGGVRPCERASSLATVRQRDASTLWLLEHSYGFGCNMYGSAEKCRTDSQQVFLSSLIRVYPSALPRFPRLLHAALRIRKWEGSGVPTSGKSASAGQGQPHVPVEFSHHVE